ncbi:MAG: methylamine utilization protein [Rubrivivax sp.]
MAMFCLAAGSACAASVDVQVLGSDGKPLAGAAVFLESPAARAAIKPISGTEIEQAARRFTHRLTVVPVGSEIQFPNRDSVRHHVYSFSPTKSFELKLYGGNASNPVLFDKSGIAVLGCNIHDNMVAWVVVVETPYYGQTDATGSVRLDAVPAGSFRLRTWHPGLPPGEPAANEALTLSAAGAKATVKLPLTAAMAAAGS